MVWRAAGVGGGGAELSLPQPVISIVADTAATRKVLIMARIKAALEQSEDFISFILTFPK
jgi:hypothetical protein